MYQKCRDVYNIFSNSQKRQQCLAANDPPARMAALRRSLAPRGRWRFVTAPSEAAIAPVLADFGQDASPSHVLKLFLVDDSGQVRNVYSTGFLDVRLLLGDLETLLDG